MNALTCQEFTENNGWRCVQVETQEGLWLYVSTPIVLEGGKPLDFYLRRQGRIVHFSDDGLTMFALRAEGFSLDDRRNWKGIENIAQKFGFALTIDGTIEGAFPYASFRGWQGQIMKMFCAIAAWQLDRMEQEDEDFSLSREVEEIMRRKAPNLRIERHVPLTLGKSEFHFDFLWGEHVYVDVLAPVPLAVNARLRKGILAGKEASNDFSLLFIVDDRKRREKADQELGVLGAVAPTMRFSDFRDHYQGPGRGLSALG